LSCFLFFPEVFQLVQELLVVGFVLLVMGLQLLVRFKELGLPHF
jgi:hypothetical protein